LTRENGARLKELSSLRETYMAALHVATLCQAQKSQLVSWLFIGLNSKRF
jgi:hypothetical protein